MGRDAPIYSLFYASISAGHLVDQKVPRKSDPFNSAF